MLHKIKTAAPLEDYRLMVRFADGAIREYDCMPLIKNHPAFAPLFSTALFNLVQVDPGGYGLSWNDDIDIDASEIYNNGSSVDSPFRDFLSFSDATTMWGLNESTLRKAISYNKLVEGVDVQKFGKQWVVTRAAMVREYGNILSE